MRESRIKGGEEWGDEEVEGGGRVSLVTLMQWRTAGHESYLGEQDGYHDEAPRQLCVWLHTSRQWHTPSGHCDLQPGFAKAHGWRTAGLTTYRCEERQFGTVTLAHCYLIILLRDKKQVDTIIDGNHIDVLKYPWLYELLFFTITIRKTCRS